MIKETITYIDYNGEERTEDFYFNLTQAEALSLELGAGESGLDTMLVNLVKSKDGGEIMSQFRHLLRLAYGVKSQDGRRFIKSAEISDEFEQCPAYNILFMKLCTDAAYAGKFAEGVVAMPTKNPGDATKEVERIIAERNRK